MCFFQGSSRNTLTGSLIIAFSSLIESQHDLLIKSFDENCFMTTYLGKSCSFCLPWVPFVNCRQFMYLVISLLVLRAGYGIWLYQFLIIAYLFTSTSLLQITFSSFASIWKLHCTCSCSQEGCRNLIRRIPIGIKYFSAYLPWHNHFNLMFKNIWEKKYKWQLSPLKQLQIDILQVNETLNALPNDLIWLLLHSWFSKFLTLCFQTVTSWTACRNTSLDLLRHIIRRKAFLIV